MREQEVWYSTWRCGLWILSSSCGGSSSSAIIPHCYTSFTSKYL